MILGLAAVLASVAAWAAGVVPGQQATPDAPVAGAAATGNKQAPASATTTPAPVASPEVTLPPPATEDKTAQSLPPATPVPSTAGPATDLPPGGQVAVVDKTPTTLPAATGPTVPTLPPAGPSPMAVAAPPASGPQAAPESTPSSQEAINTVKDIPVDPNAGPTNDNPTDRQEPGVSLEWIGPNPVRLGQPVICQIIVKNIGTSCVRQLSVRARIPEGVSVNATEPKAVTEDKYLVWNLGTMQVRQEKRLDLQVVPEARGKLAFPAFVTFTGCSTARLEVREPKLVVKAMAQREATVGDPATVTATVTNPGDATADHVKVRAVLDDGLEHARGKIVDFDLDSLAPHESRTVLVLCGARTPGTQKCDIQATADPKLSAQDAVSVEVVSPKLDVVVTGPGLRYLDRHAVYLLRVTNTGTAVAHHVSMTDLVPLGFKVVGAPGAQQDFASRTVQWFLGDLQPGQTREVTMELVAVNPGEHKNRVVVTAARGVRADGEITTRVEGLPALLMELADLDDPVEVGAKTSYEIRVTNTGTKTETNLQLVCTVPDQMECIAARGPGGCAVKVEGKQVVFGPLLKLAPRVDAIYRVSVHCLKTGDCRFRAQVNADGLMNPLLREESTRVYGDEVDASAAHNR
jgi:uncharacterized repeat protein (TIGR01451 family)